MPTKRKTKTKKVVKKTRRKPQRGNGRLTDVVRTGIKIAGVGSVIGLGALTAGVLFGGDAFNDRFLQIHNMIDRDMGLEPIIPKTTYIRPTAEIAPHIPQYA